MLNGNRSNAQRLFAHYFSIHMAWNGRRFHFYYVADTLTHIATLEKDMCIFGLADGAVRFRGLIDRRRFAFLVHPSVSIHGKCGFA